MNKEIKSLMEVPGKRTDTDDKEEIVASLDKVCEPCEVGNVNTPASGFCQECGEYMCNTCFTQHLRLKSCRLHMLLDINSSSETCLKRHSRATKCKQHDGESVKYYCRKHEAVGCGDCVVSNHNKCETEFIKNFSENFQQHEDYRTFMKQLEQLISERNEFEKKVKENKKDNKVMLEKALGVIKQFRSDINKYLDKVESDITCQVKNIMEENETLLNELENDCSMLSTKLEELTNMLNSELYKDNVLFIHTIECKPKFSESEKKMSKMKSKSMKQYEFVCDQQLRSLVTSVQKLGTLAVKSSAVFVQTIEGVNKKGVRSDVRFGARVKSNLTILVKCSPPPEVGKNGPIIQYRVAYRESSFRDNILTDADEDEELYFHLNDLKQDTVYEIRVRSLTVNGSGPWSPWLQEKTEKRIPVLPKVPQNLTSTLSDRSIALEWSPPDQRISELTGYVVGIGRFIPEVYRTSVTRDKTTHTFDNLDPETVYIVSVRSFNDFGESAAVFDLVTTE